MANIGCYLCCVCVCVCHVYLILSFAFALSPFVSLLQDQCEWLWTIDFVVCFVGVVLSDRIFFLSNFLFAVKFNDFQTSLIIHDFPSHLVFSIDNPGVLWGFHEFQRFSCFPCLFSNISLLFAQVSSNLISSALNEYNFLSHNKFYRKTDSSCNGNSFQSIPLTSILSWVCRHYRNSDEFQSFPDTDSWKLNRLLSRLNQKIV